MVEIDKLGVIFESKGAEKIIADLTNIQNKITELNKTFALGSEGLKKYQQAFDTIGKSQKGLWEKITREIKTYSKEITKSYDEEIEKLEKIKKLREEAYKGGSNNSNSGSNSDLESNNKWSKIAQGIALLSKAFVNFRTITEEKRQETIRRFNQENLTGSQSSNAVGYDIALSKYGGIRGEGLEALRGFSVGLGAATRGDISLLRTLGKWGISGINPQDDPLNVAKAIAQRSKGLSKNERLAMYAEVGFTDAQAMAAEEGDWGMFSSKGKPISVSEVIRQASESYAETSQNLAIALSDLNTSIGKFTPSVDNFVNQIPILVAAISGFSTFIASLSNAGGMLFGGGKNNKIPKNISPTTAAAGGGLLSRSPQILAASVTAYLSYKFGEFIGEEFLVPKDRFINTGKRGGLQGWVDSAYDVYASWKDKFLNVDWKNMFKTIDLNNVNPRYPYYPVNTQTSEKATNNITININSNNAYEAGEEIIRVLEQTTGY